MHIRAPRCRAALSVGLCATGFQVGTGCDPNTVLSPQALCCGLWTALAALGSCTWSCSRGSCAGRAQQPWLGGLSMWQEPSSIWERQRRWGWRFPNTVQWLGIAIVCAPNKHSSGFIHQKIKIFNMLANSTERACSCSRFFWGVQG